MAINRSALRKSSAQDLLNKVKEAAESKSYSTKDDRLWNITKDSNGNGAATIRFLPSKTEEGLPFVKVYSYGFKVNGKWFIENSPSTIGLPDPIMEANSALWNSGYEDDKNTARERKRRLSYYSNIMVLRDPSNQDNEGKVFIFRYGQKIFDKLMTVMNPPAEYGDEPRDPFSFFDGCVVKLRLKQKAGYPNYDDTVIEPAKDLFDGDEEKLEEVLEQMHDLESYHDPKNFKTYEELKARFDQLVGNAPAKRIEEDEDEEPAKPLKVKEYAAEVVKPSPKVVDEEDSDDESDEDEDDDLAFFKSLAND